MRRAPDEYNQNGETSSRIPAFPRVVFAGVVVAAGIAGVVLLSVPGSTGRFFAWPMGPPALAALVGGLYLGSAASFAVGLASTWRAACGLIVASIAFTVPTFVATLVHRDLFDFHRLLALDWVAVFAIAPVLFAWMLIRNPSPRGVTPGFDSWFRAILGAAATTYMLAGRQYVLIPSGMTITAFALPESR